MKLSRYLFAFIASLVCINVSWAQAGPAPKTIVIHAGHMLDVKTGKMLANQTILIQEDRITGVAPTRRFRREHKLSISRMQPCCRD